MCGLVGIYTLKDNGLSVDEGSMLDQAMIFNQWRGEDSTGMVCVNNKDGWTYLKAVGGYRALQRHPQWHDFRKEIMNEGRLIFGHGRWATKGTVTSGNAHPFGVKREDGSAIIFVHNGTLDYMQDLPRFYDYSVDSEWLANMIAEKGAEEALSSIFGAIACMWYDDRDKTFNFYRNHERPLYYMCTDFGEFHLNSEVTVLEYLNIKYKLNIPDKNIYMLEDKKWHSCKVNGDDTDFTIKDIKPPKRKPSSGGDRVRYFNGIPYYELSDEDDWINSGVRGQATSTPALVKPPEIKEFWDREVLMIEYIEGKKHIRYHGNRLTIEHNVTPPEPDLLRIYELGNGDIQKVYKSATPGTCTFTTVKYPHEQAKETAKKEEKNEKWPHPSTVTRNGVNVKFSTRISPSNEKVKHTGLLDEKKGFPFLVEYSNTKDGEIKIGQKVYIEVTYTEERLVKDSPMVRVLGARVKTEQDYYIDFKFWSSLPKEELDKARFFSGTISAIALQTKEQIKNTGAWIVASLNDVHPISEPTNEQAALVQAAGTVH